jgi:hypothetical protein
MNIHKNEACVPQTKACERKQEFKGYNSIKMADTNNLSQIGTFEE